MPPIDADGKNTLDQCIFIVPPKSWKFENFWLFCHDFKIENFGGGQNLKSVNIWVSKVSSIFVRHDTTEETRFFLFLKNSYGQKTGKNLPKSQSRGGGRNPPTKSKMFEYLLNGDEIENSIFADVLRIFFWSKNNIYTFLRLFFRNFKFFWSAFFWALRISMTYFFIFRPRDLRDGSKNQK